MAKVSVIELTLGKTFREFKKKIDGAHVKLSENNRPKLSVGESVFREELPPHSRLRRLFFPFQMLPSTPRNIAIHLEGANSFFEINRLVIDSHARDIWSTKEKEKIVGKIMAKSKASQQIISSGRFYLLCALIVGAIIIDVLLSRGGLR